jgi:ribosomal protein S18 acetylase RimI-like enzyme
LDRAIDARDVLVESFVDYPVMRFVVGPRGELYEERLRALIEFFVVARFLCDDLVLAVDDQPGQCQAVATVSLPIRPPPPVQLAALRERVWAVLGPEARARYGALGSAWTGVEAPGPAFHLNMIGVRPSASGRGLGRLLLEEVHARSRADAESRGVTLTTEDPANVSLYEHFGYRITGQVEVGPIRSWSFFRPDD